NPRPISLSIWPSWIFVVTVGSAAIPAPSFGSYSHQRRIRVGSIFLSHGQPPAELSFPLPLWRYGRTCLLRCASISITSPLILKERLCVRRRESSNFERMEHFW